MNFFIFSLQHNEKGFKLYIISTTQIKKKTLKVCLIKLDTTNKIIVIDFIICLGPILEYIFAKEKIKHDVIALCKFILEQNFSAAKGSSLCPSFLALVKHYSSILQKGNSGLNFKEKHLTRFLALANAIQAFLGS